jgi:hypothetical protein
MHRIGRDCPGALRGPGRRRARTLAPGLGAATAMPLCAGARAASRAARKPKPRGLRRGGGRRRALLRTHVPPRPPRRPAHLARPARARRGAFELKRNR